MGIVSFTVTEETIFITIDNIAVICSKGRDYSSAKLASKYLLLILEGDSSFVVTFFLSILPKRAHSQVQLIPAL